MKRTKSLVCLTASVLVASGSVLLPASAVDESASASPAVTEWASDDGGSAGRELPAISADGRFVVFVGRSNQFHGVWIKDRAFPAKPAVRLAVGSSGRRPTPLPSWSASATTE